METKKETKKRKDETKLTEEKVKATKKSKNDGKTNNRT